MYIHVEIAASEDREFDSIDEIVTSHENNRDILILKRDGKESIILRNVQAFKIIKQR